VHRGDAAGNGSLRQGAGGGAGARDLVPGLTVEFMRPADARLDKLLGTGAAAFRASFDLVPDPMGVLWALRDAAGAVIDFETGYANPAMDRMLGVSIEKTFGRRVVKEAPAFGDDETFKRMRAVVETGTPAVVETVIDRPGPIAPLAGVFVHRAIPFGPDAVMNLITDITGQRRLESELERYAQVAAHDLREPLMAIGLFVEQLAAGLERGRDERNERLVELLRRTDARAKLLVDGVLEYARYGTAVEFEKVDMDVLVGDVLDSLSAAILDAGASVNVGRLPTIEGNSAQLSRVFQNLIANSLKFRSTEPPRVTIAAEHRDGFWLFTVDDNGVGIPPELGDDAFVMFKRAHGDDSEGCGIGLAVCRKIVETHGGAIVAARAPGGGTSIRFSLPAVVATVPHAVPSTRS
jgi:signal transduction histidine kinase